MNSEEKTFDTARSEVETLFANPEETAPEEAIDDGGETPEDVPAEVPAQDGEQTEDFTAAETRVAENAIDAAEQAVAVAQQKNSEAEQLMAQLQAERERNASLERQLSETNALREEEIAEEMLTPPVLDIASLAFESPEAQAEAQRKYAEDMAAYHSRLMEKELAPFRERARRADELEAIETMKQHVASDPKFSGFSEMIPRLQQIIANNKNLANANIPIEDKLIQAYTIARGYDAMTAPAPEPLKEMTTEEFVAKYKGNDEFRRAIEQIRIEELKAGQQVPPLASSTGAGNVALNIKDKPTSFKDASERTRQMFRQ